MGQTASAVRANVDLTVEHAYKVGRFLGWYYGQKTPDERCRVVIGRIPDAAATCLNIPWWRG